MRPPLPVRPQGASAGHARQFELPTPSERSLPPVRFSSAFSWPSARVCAALSSPLATVASALVLALATVLS